MVKASNENTPVNPPFQCSPYVAAAFLRAKAHEHGRIIATFDTRPDELRNAGRVILEEINHEVPVTWAVSWQDATDGSLHDTRTYLRLSSALVEFARWIQAVGL